MSMKNDLKKIGTTNATAAVLLALSAALPANATQTSGAYLIQAAEIIPSALHETSGAAERLDAADRLRTLSQEITSAACHLHNGIAEDESRKLMIEAKVETIKLLDALEFGDESMGIVGSESRRKTLLDIHKIRAMWDPIEISIRTLMEDPSDVAAVKQIKATNDELYEVTSHLFVELSAEYANPFELTQLDALLIDIAGRQSMLTQRIAKEACEVWTGNRSDERLAALKDSVQKFHLGITALHDGMPELGIQPAPTPEIKVQLEDVVADWHIVKADLDAVFSGTVTDEIKADLYKRLNTKMYKMDNIVHLYTAYAHHIY